MKTALKGLFLTCALLALSGCGVSGHWTVDSVQPETAKSSFGYHCLCLAPDGAYKACMMPNDPKPTTGTYKFDEGAKTLTLTAADGKEHKYTAELIELGGKMKLTAGEKGKEWTATLKHGCCPEACGCKKAECDKAKCDPAKCPKAKAEAKPEPKVEKKPEAKPEPKVEKKPETKAETKKPAETKTK